MRTIFALSSGRPPAAIAIVRISGPRAESAAKSLCGSLPEARFATVRQLRHPATGDLLDAALVLRFEAPASATGEDLVELHCHGGRAVVDAVLAALATMDDLREAAPGEFTRRAFENGRIDLTEAEGLADLLEAETESQRKAALALAEGGLKAQVAQWQERLLALSATAELAIDYDEEDDGPPPALARGCLELSTELNDWLDQPRLEPLKRGVRVVVAGPPNSGKSSLINRIAGEEKAIVTEIPGTTRDFIEVPLSLNGVPILLTDTAGLRQASDAVEAIGVQRAKELAETADILVWMGDPASAPDHPRRVQVAARADLQPTAVGGGIAVSAKTGQGVAELLAEVETKARRLLPGEDAIALNRRQADEIAVAAASLEHAAGASDAVIAGEELRAARSAFDRLTGRAGVEDLLEALFSRFCLGK